ncbi:MAG: acetate kinase [Candidatus Omnitrophica bacterium]|nr:acetate kinase [Candidatus Omnitrophota bacterium]
MYILVINSGSSSVKYKLFDVRNNAELAKGIVERIGLDKSSLTQQAFSKDEIRLNRRVTDHNQAIKFALQMLAHEQYGAIRNTDEIAACGHRVVHGGEEFSGSVVITGRVMKAIKSHFDIAPLHNPPNLLGIKVAKKLLPKIRHVAVFDTAFHQTIPPSAFLYGLPYSFYEKDKIRRYGFHGTSHRYVAQRASEILKRPQSRLKLITVHLGNGCSITAVKNGKSINTSMGFTPLEGLVMGTRSGDIDPAVVFHLMHKKKLSYYAIDELLNKKSGLLGMSEVGSDMRDVYNAVKKGNRKARLAFEVFIDRIHKYVGSYAVAMDGVDAIVFTAGIGENHAPTRAAVCRNLSFLGVRLDAAKNNSSVKEKIITTAGSKTKVLVVPTNEELLIAQETHKFVK